MSDSFFDPINAVNHQFYLVGRTGDYHYTNGLIKVSPEWMVFLELKRSGFERIYFYDNTKMLYCYDDMSYELIHGRPEIKMTEEPAGTQTSRSSRRRLGTGTFQVTYKEASNTGMSVGNETALNKTDAVSKGKWIKDKNIDVSFLHAGNEIFHLGRNQNSDSVRRMIIGWIEDESIRTAVVVRDSETFLRLFGSDRNDFLSTRLTHLDPDNRNAIVFFMGETDFAQFTQDHSLRNDHNENIGEEKLRSIIRIQCPTVIEVRNLMLWMHFRTDNPLQFRYRELMPLAEKIYASFIEDESMNAHVDSLYQRFDGFAKSNMMLTLENWSEALGLKAVQTAEEELNSLIGMNNVKEKLSKFKDPARTPSENYDRITDSPIRPNKPSPNNKDMIHILLTGNPGTGKTTVAKLIGRLFREMGYLDNGHVVHAKRSELVSQYIGETAIKTRNKVMEAMGGVLFIDEAYSLVKGNNDNVDYGKEAIDELVDCMVRYKGEFILVAAGYPHDMADFVRSNEGLFRRFTVQINIDDYSVDELIRLMEFHAKKNGLQFSEDFRNQMPNFCKNWMHLKGLKNVEVGKSDWVKEAKQTWGNAGEVTNLIEGFVRTLHNYNSLNGLPASNNVITTDFIPEELRQFLTPAEEMRNSSLKKLENLTGLKSVKEKIKDIYLAGEIEIGKGKKIPGHYIFVGNPGTGKTTVARLFGELLHNLGLLKRGHLLECSASSLIQQLHNNDPEIDGNIENVFRLALDGVLFIDEAYQLLNSPQGQRISESLLSFMENHKENLCVIFAGYEEDIDNLIDSNDGFKSRFGEKNKIVFENFKGEELYNIFENKINEDDIQSTSEFMDGMHRALVQIGQRNYKGFGNARYIINEVVPEAVANCRRRIAKSSEPLPKELTEEDYPSGLKPYVNVPISKVDNRSALEKLNSMVGYKEIKDELNRLQIKSNSEKDNRFGAATSPERLYWVLKGGSGTGKSTIVNLIAQAFHEFGLLPYSDVKVFSKSQLVAEHVGGTAQLTEKAIEKSIGHVMFVDEAYSLTEQEDDGNKSFGSEAIDVFVAQMEQRIGQLAIIFAGYPAEMDRFLENNKGLSSRVKQFTLEDYTPAEMKKIFISMCSKNSCVLDENLDSKMELFFENMKKTESKIHDWGNAREAEKLKDSMIGIWTELDNKEPQPYIANEDGSFSRILNENHIPDNYKKYINMKPAKKEKQLSVLESIDNLVGFDELKEYLRGLLEYKNIKDEDKDLTSGLNLHLLLQGSPGTGKSTVAKLIGKVYREAGLLSRGHTVKVTRDDLVAEYMGQSAIKTKKKIKEAMGGVLFIDEAYSLVNGNQDEYGREVIQTILESMTDMNGLYSVIAAGYPREMEMFISSNSGFSSRFGHTFTLPDYTENELTEIFKIKCRDASFSVSPELAEKLPVLFRNWKNSSPSDKWANGRKAENLEAEMRPVWIKNPEKDEDGNRIYTLNHIPASYSKYLDGSAEKKEDSAKEKIKIEEMFFEPSRKDFNFNEYDNSIDIPGLVYIKVTSARGSGSGSGSIITRNGYVLTCNHVIEGAEQVSVRITPNVSKLDEIEWKKAEIVWADKELDMAILLLEEGIYNALPMMPPDKSVSTGSSIYHWGFPFGKKLNPEEDELQPSYFKGIVSSSQFYRGSGLKRIFVNMEAKSGCSGGPVFSKETGDIIGILCGSVTSRNHDLIEELNFFRPVEFVWERIFDMVKSTVEESAD